MKTLLTQSSITLNRDDYISILIILMPLLNFLGGVNIDIYAPSMPSIAAQFHASMGVVKNTITATIIGWGFGAVVFGTAIDYLGRKKTVLAALVVYILASLFAPFSLNVYQLLLVRFVQGFATVALSIGCRAIISDNIVGRKFTIAIVYTSIGYGLGPVIGPFIGGLLQYYVGWKANFVALALLSSILLSLVLLFVDDHFMPNQKFNIRCIIKQYSRPFKNNFFITGILLLGLTQIQMLLYPTIAPFLMENQLHLNSVHYGYTALIIGATYLLGGLLNRHLLKHVAIITTCHIAYLILGFACILTIIFALFQSLNVMTVIIPIAFMNVSAGFMFSNIMASNIKLFRDKIGIAMAMQMTVLALITATGIFLASHINHVSLSILAFLYSVIFMMTCIIFYSKYIKVMRLHD